MYGKILTNAFSSVGCTVDLVHRVWVVALIGQQRDRHEHGMGEDSMEAVWPQQAAAWQLIGKQNGVRT